MKILFVTVEWMKYYVGEGDEEKPVPPCGWNFQYINGSYYGYSEGLDHLPLEQFEGSCETDEKVEDVLVVWLAKNRDGDKCIVGWYKEATIYRKAKQTLTLDSERLEMTYSIVAPANKGLLLPVEERRYAVNHIQDNVHIESKGLTSSQVMSYIHNYQGDHMNLVLTQEEINKSLTINMNYEQYFYKADEFLARDSYAKAIKCFNKAIQEEPQETLGYECKGSILLSLKMYDEAIAVYHEVIKRDKTNELAHYCLGLLYGLTKQYEKALTYYDFYLQRREDAHAQAEKALIYYVQGNKEQAYKILQQAYKSEPENQVIIKLKKLLN